MKSFIILTVFIVFSAVVMSNPHDPEMHKHIDDCIKEHHISPKEFHDFMEGKVATASENLKCTTLCVMNKQGIMDEAGTFKPDAAKAKMADDEKFVAAVNECKSQTGSSPCDTAMKVTQCMIKHK